MTAALGVVGVVEAEVVGVETGVVVVVEDENDMFSGEDVYVHHVDLGVPHELESAWDDVHDYDDHDNHDDEGWKRV